MLVMRRGLSLVKHEHAGMQGATLLQRRSEGSVKALLKVELALPLDDVREQVAVEGRVLGEQLSQVEGALGGDEIGQAHLAGWHIGPVAGGDQAMVGIRTVFADALEDHAVSVGSTPDPRLPHRARGLQLECVS